MTSSAERVVRDGAFAALLWLCCSAAAGLTFHITEDLESRLREQSSTGRRNLSDHAQPKWVKMSMAVPQIIKGTGPNTIMVTASATLAGGIGAHFNLVVDGTTVGSATVGAGLSGYGFRTTLAPGRAHDIQVVYDNDTVINGQDRNLNLQSIAVDGQVVDASSPYESYRPVGQASIAGSGSMYWGGIADFALPISYFPMPPPSVMGSGPDTVVVNASATLAAGVGAHFNLIVDGKTVGNATVGTTLQGYTFHTALAAGQMHDIQVVYDNDTVINGQDRNLNLQSLAVNGQMFAANSSYETYRPAGQNAIAGSGNMIWAGTADFALPANIFSTSSLPHAASYYVSAVGDDGGDGSAAHPFATLRRAQAAMEHSTIRTTCVEDGTYNLTASLRLTSADNGMSFIAAPAARPVLNGGPWGLVNLVTLNGTQNVTLQGLTFENTTPGYSNAAVLLVNATSNRIVGNLFANNDRGVGLDGSGGNVIAGNEFDNSVAAGVSLSLGSDNNTIDSNRINGVSPSGTGTGSAGIWLSGANHNTITHNLIENTGGAGIAVENWEVTNAALNLNVGNTIAYNSVVNANSSPQSDDSGGIYILGRTGIDTHTLVNNNSVSLATSPITGLSVGIYLDDFASGVSVTNNIVTNGNFAFLIHGGENNTLSNNIFDLGSRSALNVGAGLFQSNANGPIAAMSGNSATKNIIYSAATSSPGIFLSYDGTGAVSDNLYYNIHGQAMTTLSPLKDSNPHVGDPMFADAPSGNYGLGSGSAASAIGFKPINQVAIGLAPTTPHWY